MKTNKKQQIKDILENFDFVKAYYLIKADTEYEATHVPECFTEDDFIQDHLNFYKNFKIPTPQELMENAKKLLNEVVDEDLKYLETGFLRVDKIEWDDGTYTLRMSLDLDSWEYEWPDEDNKEKNDEASKVKTESEIIDDFKDFKKVFLKKL